MAVARAIAQEQRRSLGRVLSELARSGIAPRTMKSKSGLPMFDVDGGAPVITPDMVERALHSDD